MKKNLIITFSLMIVFSFQLNAQTFTNASSMISSNLSPGSGELGSPVSFADFNQDGLDDLTIGSASGLPLRFYQNNGAGFSLVILNMPPLTCDSKHVLWVDYDNDGDRDLFVTCNMLPNRLYRNNGSLNFTDVTPTSGLAMENDPSWGAAFGDYNKDGLLDLYVVNLVQGGSVTTHCNHLYQNTGTGSFTDVTWATNTPDSLKAPFCVAFFDYDDDSWPDMYLAQDRYIHENTMFRNEGTGVYTDASVSTNTHIAIGAMNVGVADYDNDSDLDIYITNDNTAPFNILYTNNGNSTFTDDASFAGVRNYSLSWAANFADFDNDTWQDLYVCNQFSFQPNHLFMNNGNSTFDSLTIAGDTRNNYVNAIGDYNSDGFPDIAISGFSTFPNVLWQNTSSSGNNWLKVNLQGTISNREGIGSWIEIYINGNKYVRYTHCGIAYLAQNSFTEIIGLGQATTIDSVKVRWLSGIVDKITQVSANQTINVIENSTSTNLPVELLNFSATPAETSIDLKWATATELNFDNFELERSSDGLSFAKIYRAEAQVNPDNGSQYGFEDNLVFAGQLYYYRLKMNDDNGEFRYSQVVSAKLEMPPGIHFSILQNPVSSEGPILKMLSSSNIEATVQVHSLNGNLVFAHKNFSFKEGINKVTMSSFLPSGIYLVTLNAGNTVSSTHKLVVF